MNKKKTSKDYTTEFVSFQHATEILGYKRRGSITHQLSARNLIEADPKICFVFADGTISKPVLSSEVFKMNKFVTRKTVDKLAKERADAGGRFPPIKFSKR